jgi:nucleotide-binding universal stress UspA family protein
MRILVPVDFSAASRHALRKAIELARATTDSSVEVLHVVPPRKRRQMAKDATAGRRVASVDANVVHRAERELVTFVSSVPHGGVHLRSWIDPGIPAGSIVQEATDERFDLIVMGTRARTGLKAAILGSVAQAVVSCAPCPVMLVRNGSS